MSLWVHPGSPAGDGSDEVPLETTIADDGVDDVAVDARQRTGAVLCAIPPVRGNATASSNTRCDTQQCADQGLHLARRRRWGGQTAALPDTFIMDSFNFLTPVDEATTVLLVSDAQRRS
jgi:vanillate O-demethylase monooxygenase subunit